MPASNPISHALRDLVEDVAWHAGNVLQGAVDLACLVAVAAAFYAASLDPAPNLASPDMTAEAGPAAPATPQGPCMAGLDPAGGCITAHVLADPVGT